MVHADPGYLESLYTAWREDAGSVDPSWAAYFVALENGGEIVSDVAGASDTHATPGTAPGANYTGRPSGVTVRGEYGKQARVDALIWAYRDVAAMYANINPLGTYETPKMRYMRITVEGAFETLSLSAFGLSEADLDAEFDTGGFFDPPRAPLRDIIAMVKETYLSTLGIEFLHIKNRVMRRWLLDHIEGSASRRTWSREQKVRFQKDLIKAEVFERFVHSNFVGQKRFSLEGSEALVPALHYLIYSAAQHGLLEIVLGMAHRGRLNVFTNALRKPAAETFAKFIDTEQPHEYGGSGDVKYHLGHSFTFVDGDSGKAIHISLVANPSHLEAVDPVVEGKARGIQRRRGDRNRKKVMPVLIHGDAAFNGQGVVAETFNLGQLEGYRTGGTIHIIVNNQIGFTTASRDARSTFFPTDFAKSLQVPIFHANGDDPEAVVRAVDLAIRWRQKFGYDAVVDIVCYRRLGHNEADEPVFTHPIMYSLIKDHPSAPTLYGERLERAGIWPRSSQEEFSRRYWNVLKEQLGLAREGKITGMDDAFQGELWNRFSRRYSFDPVETGVDHERILQVGRKLVEVPEGFPLHGKLKRLVTERTGALETGEGIDWGFAEALSFGTLLTEGFAIRLSGEDSSRGTFSHRHAEWWDIESEVPRSHVPFKHLAPDQASFSVYDSPLSEFAVLGFDYGYALAQPDILVIWEAQFGDFVNGAQVIIDQFVASSESKWFRSNGLVMLLPHGYEGQGPEHSSAHLERFLQMCAEDNLQVVNPTTPAQAFHLFRRQMLQNVRKPLIVMSPKSLLRKKEAHSTLRELETGHFQTIIDDEAAPESAETLLFCSGKVYYDLDDYRSANGERSAAIIRVEQLYPWDRAAIERIAGRYKRVKRVRWVQEESRNRGAWRFVRNRLREICACGEIEYVGRAPSPSPASGSFSEHIDELKTLLSGAFSTDGGKP